MATGSVRPVRNLRSGRFARVRHESTDDVVIKLDFTKDPSENVKEILGSFVQQRGMASGRKTAYLNSFVKLIKSVGYKGNLGMAIPHIMVCLEIGLLHEAKQVRTASLRVIRYLLPYEETLESFLSLHLDYLVARSLDISLDNEIERIHTVKLMRQIIKMAPDKFPKSLLYALIAIGNDGVSERDRMVRVSLETICELAFWNVDVLAKCGGIQTLIWNILDCHQYPRLNEALTATVLYLLNHPKTRHYIKPQVDLERLLAPFTDSHFRYSIDDGRGEERETRFIASKMAVITVMRSWPGLIRLCHPEGAGMQSLIGILYMPYIEIRKYILEVISDLFRLTLPSWSDEFAIAFSSVDPSVMKDGWKLMEGFVAEEGRAILMHVSKTRPNLIENHLSLLLSSWITAGLLEALVEVVISSEGALFNRAVLLLAELLNMASCLLPPECTNHSECLPTLIAMASSSQLAGDKRRRAHQAVMYLMRFHKMIKRGRKPCSLYLDQLLQHAGKMSEVTSKRWHLRREKLSEFFFRQVSAEDISSQAIRDSYVLTTKGSAEWKWPIIGAVLKWPDEKLRKMDDQLHLKFIRRLLYHFKPENDLFSKTDIADGNSRIMCIVCCYLIDFLLACGQEETDKMINEFLSDINENLKEVTKLTVPVDENAMFGARRLHEKLCRFYFLFIGRFTSTKKGCIYLEKAGIIQSLLELMAPTTNIVYVKLALSALNFSLEGPTRPILSKALTSTADICRLYATRLLRVLMRAGTASFSQWGVELLVTQLYDQEKSVAMSAINILDEACDQDDSLQTLIKSRPALLHLGDKGDMLLSRFLSSIQGFRSLNSGDFISSQLTKWQTKFNAQYVDIVEEMLNEALMTYEKTFSGSCPRRSIFKGPKKDVFLPSHLYGQLTMHEEGLALLQSESCIQDYFNCIRTQILLNDKDVKTLKIALWAIGHIGLSVDGLTWLESENIIPELIRLAEECGVFSVRGTSFFVLGLIASTRRGTDILCDLGWESRCHTRKESWPVLDQDGWLHGPMAEALRLSDQNASSAQLESSRIVSSSSSGLALIHEENYVTLRKTSPLASNDSIHSTKDHNHRNSSSSISSLTSPNLMVPNASKSQDMNHYVSDFKLPIRSKSDKKSSIKTVDFRPRSLSSEKRLSMTEPPVDIKTSSNNSLIGVETVKISIGSPSENDHLSSSQESCQLMASPVIKIKPSCEDNTSAITSTCDIPKSVHAVQNDSNSKNGNGFGGSRTSFVENRESSTDVPHDESSKSAIESDVSKKEKLEDSKRCASFGNSYSDGSGNLESRDHEVVSFQIGGSGALTKGSSSSDSSNRSKSRGSSFNTTDSNTSGVGSCDSGRHLGMPIMGSSLTPIPSSSSLTTVSSSSNLLTGAEQVKQSIHPSAAQRSLFRLSRVPSSKRSSAAPALGMAPNGPQSYTSYRDAVGYAALKSIKRQRTYSSEIEDVNLSTPDASAVLRSLSNESDGGMDNSMWLSIRRNVSSASLQDQEGISSPTSVLNKAVFKPLSPSNRFVGLTLPVDVKMVFEVFEGEDKRSSALPSIVLPSNDQSNVPVLKKETSFEHTTKYCLICSEYRNNILPENCRVDAKDEHGDFNARMPKGVKHDCDLHQRSESGPVGSVTNTTSSTPGSQGSNQGSQGTDHKKLTEDSLEGRELIRLEVMRLIINLGSSVGLKGSETGLLRERARAYYHRKKAEKGESPRQTVTSATSGRPKSSTGKKPVDMNPEEYRAHKAELRRIQRAALSHQKKTAIRAKDREAKRQGREATREARVMELEAPSSDGKMKQAFYNLNSHYKKRTKELGMTYAEYAKSTSNLTNPKTPEKRAACDLERQLRAASCKSLFSAEINSQPDIDMEAELAIELQDDPILGPDMEDEIISKPLHWKIGHFYCRDDISRLLPHARYSTKHGPARVMTLTLKDAHSKFLEEQGSVVGLTLFQTLRPRNVRLLGSVPLESCLCIYCTNIRLKLIVLNQVLGSSSCLPMETSLFGFITCPYEGRWPNIQCIDGTCPSCTDRIRPFKVVCRDVFYVDAIKWTRWERNDSGKVEPQLKEGTVGDLITELKKDLDEPTKGTSFLQHLFTAYWQCHQFKGNRTNPEEGEVIMIQDFGENRKAAYASEIKSAHFGKSQITVHPVVCFYRVGEDVVRESHIFLSDDIQHDFHAVRAFTEKSLEMLKGRLAISKVTIWSDGAASQYKGRGTFRDLSVMSEFEVQRCYFGSEHGKGEADGETGLMSQAIKRAVYQGINFSNALDMVKYLDEHHGSAKRKYILVSDIDRTVADDVLPIQGCRKLHQYKRQGDFRVQARKLACFCTACREGRCDLCINIDVVGSFKTHRLKAGLKQRFPKCFQNLCFYSEVCHLLASYSYRLLARRFIHELFDDLDFRELIEAPCRLLGLDIDLTSPMTPIRQDSQDEFQDFSFS